jgi:hypothetical protein
MFDSPLELPLVCQKRLRQNWVQQQGIAVEVMDLIAERRDKLFPDLRKIILDYEAEIGDGRLKLDVTSAPIPNVV